MQNFAVRADNFYTVFLLSNNKEVKFTCSDLTQIQILHISYLFRTFLNHVQLQPLEQVKIEQVKKQIAFHYK